METRKTATKKTSRAKLNVLSEKSKTQSRAMTSTKKTDARKYASAGIITAVGTGLMTAGVKQAKKSPKSVLAFFVCLILGLIIGATVVYSLVSKNDCFNIIGGDELTYTLDEKYVEQGATIIEFNKDISNDVIIESNLNLDENGYSTEIGTFYVKYSVDSLKYGKIFKIEKIRLVTFVEVSEGGE